MKILIADDKPYVRSALRFLLEQEFELSVFAEAGSFQELRDQLKGGCPDTLLVDWELPGGDIKGLIQALKAGCPCLNTLAMSSRPEARRFALEAGADGFISKASTPQEVIAAVKNIPGGALQNNL